MSPCLRRESSGLIPHHATRDTYHFSTDTMAEIFGIAAGLVGLASLGLQLPNSISELRDIRHTYKDAPDEIAALITTLEDLRLILESCTITGPSAADDVQEQLLENCKRRCLDIRNSISDVLQPIRAAIQQTPKTAKIKAVFQKKTSEGWLQKLRWSMLELLLAHQIFGRYLNACTSLWVRRTERNAI